MPPINGKRIALLLSAVLALLAAGSVPVGGQARRIAVDRMPERDRNTTESGVFVRDSAIAADKFELGKRMERLKEWHKSADVYDEILQKYQDRVVPTLLDDHDQPVKFQSVAVAVQERLARWPDEGLSVYRTRFEPIASALLDQSRRDDYATLHKVLGQYFVTDSARQAGIRLMDLYLEAGDFSAAAWISDRLLALHPNLGNERPAILLRSGLAHHLAGNPALAARRLEQLKTKFAAEKTIIAGKEVTMVEALSAQLAQKPPRATGSAEDSWRTVGGDETRNLIGVASGRPGARIYTMPLPPMSYGSARTERQTDDIWINIMPALDRGELFFQDGQRVYAVYLETGMPLPGWAQTYPQRNGQYQVVAVPNPVPDFAMTLRSMPQQYSITLTDDSVLAVMGQPLVSNTGYGMSTATGTRLVCLDRATGREKWIGQPESLPNNAGGARNLNFSGCPLVVGDNVYIIARGSTGGGVEDCHVLCFDLQKGIVNWTSYIASAQTLAPNMGGMPIPSAVRPDTLSHLAFSSGRVYVMTNLGAVGAIDAYSGTTMWLSLYPRDRTRALQLMGGPNRLGGLPATTSELMPKPWEFSPVCIQEGRVFALPTDANELIVYDAGTGDEVKRVPRDFEVGDYASQTRRLSSLVGVSGDMAVVAARDYFMVINWAKFRFRGESSKPTDESLLYASPLETKGRPFLTASHVYLPLKSRLVCFDLVKRKIVDSYPRGNAGWPDDEGPGNVVVAKDHVIIANARGISVYTDLQGVRQKYDLAIKANPADVDARLVFAEMMFNARELDDARAAMRDAVDVLGGQKAMCLGAQRDRVFTDCILFAQKLAADRAEKSLALADQLYDLAGSAASTPSQNVNYRFSRARFIDALRSGNRDEVAKAVWLYQEVISDPQMRIIMLAGDQSGSIQAGRAAEDAIAGMISRYGADCYKPFEQEAWQKLKDLGPEGSPDQLLALAENYPNAVQAASASMMQAAQSYAKSGNARMATQVLRRIYWKYPARANTEKAALVEAMARNYLRLGNVGAALGRLQRLGAAGAEIKLAAPLLLSDGRPLTKPTGQPVETIKEALDSLQQLAKKQAALPLPDVNLPPFFTAEDRKAGKTPFAPEDDQLNIHNVQAVLEAPPEQREGDRFDRLVVRSNGRLMCYAPGTSAALWSSDAPVEPALGIFCAGKTMLVWSEGRLAMLDADSGKAAWTVELRALAPVELVAGGASAESRPPPTPPASVPLPVARRVVPGVVPPPVAPPPQPPGGDGRERVLHVRRLSDRAIFTTTTGRVCAVDLNSGQLLWQTRLANSRAIQQTLSTDEFTAIRLLTDNNSSQLIVLDSYNAQQIFRFSSAPGSSDWAMNCVLSSDGTLVWTTPQSVAAKDLYEPGEQPTWQRPAQGRSYAGMIQPDQLCIWGQQVLVLCDGGRMIERRSLRTGDQIDQLLNTNAVTMPGDTDSAAVRLRLDGSRLFAVGVGSAISYDLEDAASTRMSPNNDVSSIPSEALLTRDFMIIPGKVNNAEGSYALQCYSRELVGGKQGGKPNESGRQSHRFGLNSTGPIKSWVAVNGGVYYLTADGTLHWLRGTKP